MYPDLKRNPIFSSQSFQIIFLPTLSESCPLLLRRVPSSLMYSITVPSNPGDGPVQHVTLEEPNIVVQSSLVSVQADIGYVL